MSRSHTKEARYTIKKNRKIINCIQPTILLLSYWSIRYHCELSIIIFINYCVCFHISASLPPFVVWFLLLISQLSCKWLISCLVWLPWCGTSTNDHLPWGDERHEHFLWIMQINGLCHCKQHRLLAAIDCCRCKGRYVEGI